MHKGKTYIKSFWFIYSVSIIHNPGLSLAVISTWTEKWANLLAFANCFLGFQGFLRKGDHLPMIRGGFFIMGIRGTTTYYDTFIGVLFNLVIEQRKIKKPLHSKKVPTFYNLEILVTGRRVR